MRISTTTLNHTSASSVHFRSHQRQGCIFTIDRVQVRKLNANSVNAVSRAESRIESTRYSTQEVNFPTNAIFVARISTVKVMLHVINDRHTTIDDTNVRFVQKKLPLETRSKITRNSIVRVDSVQQRLDEPNDRNFITASCIIMTRKLVNTTTRTVEFSISAQFQH